MDLFNEEVSPHLLTCWPKHLVTLQMSGIFTGRGQPGHVPYVPAFLPNSPDRWDNAWAL